MRALSIGALCLCLLLVSVFAEKVRYTAGSSGLDVDVNLSDGSYTVLVDDQPWFMSTAAGFHTQKNWYTTTSGLKLVGTTDVKGTDSVLGSYTGVDIEWNGNGISFHTIFQTFSSGAVVFNQYFPNGVESTSINTNEDVLSSFPTLANATSAQGLFYFTYQNWPFAPLLGNWLTGFPNNINGGAPAAFYNTQLRTVLFSPLNNLMVGMQARSQSFKNSLAFGINGLVESIPANFTHRTLLVAGQGINETFYSWGEILLAYNGKQRTQPDADILIQYLGYWTDNGAYYYYITEPNKTYSQTMIDVYKYVSSTPLPIKSYQFDSWWYFKGVNDGVSLWEPMPTIFPEGMAYVHSNMGNMPLALHNRYFSPDNEYQKNFSFAIESKYALPLEEALYTYIMNKAKGWGMILYEQDWLVTTYMGMQATQNNVTTARNWLLNMGNAAAALDLTIQYCMPLPLHLLQSTEVPVVTQTRVTNDYNPGNTQWQIGFPSILAWSVGLFPFKDDFWTTSDQPGCKYSSCVEPNPVLETLVAALSTGPVGPSDAIGKLNIDLIMKTCTSTGLLLKADKPTTALDKTFVPQPGFSFPSTIEVWDSFTSYGNNRWHYILAAQLTAGFTVLPADIGLAGINSVVFDYFAFTSGHTSVAPFDETHSLQIPNQQATLSVADAAAGVVPFNYYIVAPILQSGWALLGEVNKFIPVSHQRISSVVTDTSSTFAFSATGNANEQVSFLFYNTASQSISNITVSYQTNAQSVTITCTKTACSQ